MTCFIELDNIYFNPDKIVAISIQPGIAYTNIWVGGDDNHNFRVNLSIQEVMLKLEKVGRVWHDTK